MGEGGGGGEKGMSQSTKTSLLKTNIKYNKEKKQENIEKIMHTLN